MDTLYKKNRIKYISFLLGFFLIFNLTAGVFPPQTFASVIPSATLADPISLSGKSAGVATIVTPDFKKAYEESGLTFQVNKGQFPATVKYRAKGAGYNLFLTGNEAVFALDLPNSRTNGFAPPQKSLAKPAKSATPTPTAIPASTPIPTSTPKAGKSQFSDSEALAGQAVGTEKTSTKSVNPPLQATYRMSFEGANPNALVEVGEEASFKSSYFLGGDSTKWIQNVSSYISLRYKNIYPGVDLVYYSQKGKLKYDLILAPGVDPNIITLSFAGVDKTEITPAGELKLQVQTANFQHLAPLTYQEINSKRQEVKAEYYTKATNQLGFKLGNYDKSKALVIDPEMVYSTILDGYFQDNLWGAGVATDQYGNFYATGMVSDCAVNQDLGVPVSPNADICPYITLPPPTNKQFGENVFVAKFDKTGTPKLFFYLGGTLRDYATSIAVDKFQNVYITGFTNSYDLSSASHFPYPTTENAYSRNLNYDTVNSNNSNRLGDSFITALNMQEKGSDGIFYSTYFGGKRRESGNSIAIYSDDFITRIYIAGETGSSTLPLTSGAVESQFDNGFGLDDSVDPATAGFITVPEGFVSVFDPLANGAAGLLYSTYVGGTVQNPAYGIALDANKHVYVTGFTAGGLPLKNAIQSNSFNDGDVFVVKLNPDPTKTATENLLFSTYLGGDAFADWTQGDGFDTGNAIGVDSSGSIYLTGSTRSKNFPVPATAKSHQRLPNGRGDAFVARIDQVNPGEEIKKLVYSSYLGGTEYEESNSLAIYRNGIVAITGQTDTPATGTAKPFPTKNGLLGVGQVNTGAGKDAFVTKIATNLDGDGSLLDSTYLGGSGWDRGSGIAVDFKGDVIATGFANEGFPANGGSDFPLTVPRARNDNNAYSDGFVTKFTFDKFPSLGGCDGGAVRAIEFVNVGTAAEQLSCQRVNPANGNYVASAVDLNIKAPPQVSGFSLSFGRAYNSQDVANAVTLSELFPALGWRHSHQWDILEDTISGLVTVTLPSGRRDVYPSPPDIASPANPNPYGDSLLQKVTSPESGLPYELLLTNEQQLTTYRFRDSRLEEVRDHNGNGLNYIYQGTALRKIVLCLNPCVSSRTANQTNVVQSLDFVTTNGTNSKTIEVTDQEGHKVKYFIENNLLKQFTDARLSITTFSYETAVGINQNCLKTVTDPLGHDLIKLNYDSKGRVANAGAHLHPPLTFNYDVQGQTLATDFFNNTTAYYYDRFARVTAIYDANQKTTSFTYNGEYQLSRFTDANGAATNYTYNSQSKLLEATLKKVSIPGEANQVEYKTSTIYNEKKLPTDIKDVAEKLTKIDYEADKTNPKKITDTATGNTLEYFYEANAPGRVKKTITSNGLTTEYFYDSHGFPSKVETSYVTNVFGQAGQPVVKTAIDYEYDSNGWLKKQSNPYDANNPPTQKLYVEYTYDEVGHPKTVKNQLLKTSTNNYDAAGRLTSSVNFQGQQATKDYNENNWLTKSTLIRSDGSRAESNLVTDYEYDSLGNVKKITDARQVSTTFDYDVLYRLKSKEVAFSGGMVRTEYPEYDGLGNLKKLVEKNATAGDRLTEYTYDELSRLITLRRDGTGFNYSTTNYYDKGNNVIKITQDGLPGGEVVLRQAEYDSLNRLKTATSFGTVNNTQTTLTTNYTYDNVLNKQTILSPDGSKIEKLSDPAGQLIEIKAIPATTANGEQAQLTRYFYYPDGKVSHLVAPSDNSNGHLTTFEYDGLLRPKKTTKYSQPGATGAALATTYTYDDSSPEPKVTVFGPNNYKNDLEYDEANRLRVSTIYATTPLVTTYNYDGQGNLTEVKNANNNKTFYTYENTGWLKGVTQDVTSAGQLQTLNTTYTYDALGNVVKATKANGEFDLNTYDKLGRLATTENRLGNKTLYTYDGLDQLISSKDPKGQLSSYTYDRASWLTSVNTLGVTTANILTNYLYNEAGLPTKVTEQVGANSVATDYQYDGHYRLSKVTNPQGSVAYTYDNSNRRKSMTFGPSLGLKTVNYEYDALDRIKKIIPAWTSPNVNEYTYDDEGERVDTLTYPNGTVASFTYDAAGRLNNLEHKTNGNQLLFSASYSLDGVGNVSGSVENINNVTRHLSYSYDELNRLTSETFREGSPTANPRLVNTYVYDRGGNRISSVTTQPALNSYSTTNNYSYNIAGQLVSSSTKASNLRVTGNYTYSYDANGSLVNEIYSIPNGSYNTSYIYDARNRMTGWQKQSGGSSLPPTTASFEYDGNNNRTKLTLGNQTTQYLQDIANGLPVVLQESKAGQASPDSYVYAPGTTTPLLQTGSTGTTALYHPDRLGSVRVMTENSAVNSTILNSYSYDAYGQVTSQSGNSSNSHGFAGEQLDPTGLYYNRARYYSSATGRFTQQDSYLGSPGNPASLNLYSYAYNNPASLTDPGGHSPLALGALALGAFFLGIDIWQGVETWNNRRATPLDKGLALGAVALDLIPTTWLAKGLGWVGKGFGWAAKQRDNGVAAGRRIFGEVPNFAAHQADNLPALAHNLENAAECSVKAASASSFNSFVAGTPVLTEGGLKPIEQIAVGDKVWAKNPETGEEGYRAVTWLTNHTAEEVIQISVSNPTEAVAEQAANYDYVAEPAGIVGASQIGSQSGSSSGPAPAEAEAGITEATPQHPIWVIGKGWVHAGELVVGDKLLTKDGSYLTVSGLKLVKKPVQVYNFEVAELHTYFVGEQEQWLVHNTGIYDCRQWRDHFEQTWGADRVTSTTIGKRNARSFGVPVSREARAGTRAFIEIGDETFTVPFDERGYPIFDEFVVFDTRLSRATYTAAPVDRIAHFRAATGNLSAAINANPRLGAPFTAAQLDQIHNLNSAGLHAYEISGFTWHHHQDFLRMQLIPTELHGHPSVRHFGGFSMWQGR